MRSMHKFLVGIALILSVLSLRARAGPPIVHQFDFAVQKILWLNDQVGFVIGEDMNLYRSGDYGITWIEQNSLMPNSREHGIYDMYTDAFGGLTCIFLTNDTHGWISYSGENPYTYTNFGQSFSNIISSPAKYGHFLGQANCIGQFCDTYFTEDVGKNWQLISPWSVVSWSQDGESLFVLKLNGTFGYTIGFSSNMVVLANGVGTFHTLNDFVLYSVPDSAGRWNEFYASSAILDPSHKILQKYLKAYFPQIITNTYEVLWTNTSAAWIALEHYQQGTGDLFISDSSGTRYILSLENIASMNGYFDFDVIRSVEGVFIANYIENAYETIAKRKSVITFNNGGRWLPIKAPLVDANNKPYDCPQCTLHLSGASARFSGVPRIYSTRNAVGLVLAVGNVGDYLAQDQADMNTYMSRDAGLTWTELSKGPSIYEFGNHGAILVSASSTETTSLISFSLTEGAIWDSIMLPTAIKIASITTAPMANSTTFLIQGEAAGFAKPYGLMYVLDFNTSQSFVCSQSAFENFTVYDGIANETCILGRKVTYTRRIRNAECHVPINYEPVLSSVNCPCNWNDYECDLGFEAAMWLGDFFRCDVKGDNYLPNCSNSDAYYVGAGYRRVPGDSCVGGRALLPERILCDSPSDSSSDGGSGSIIVAIIVIALVLSAVGAAVYIVKNPEVKGKISGIFSSHEESKTKTESRPKGKSRKSALLEEEDEDDEHEAPKTSETTTTDGDGKSVHWADALKTSSDENQTNDD